MKGLPGTAKRDRGIYQTLKGLPGTAKRVISNLEGLTRDSKEG